MTYACLPAKIEEYLLDVAADHSQRSIRQSWLRFSGDVLMRDSFLQALLSPSISVHASICDDELGPGEICVRASGDDRHGNRWNDLAIMLLAPHWADQSMEAQDLADDIVEHWDRLRDIAGDIARAAA